MLDLHRKKAAEVVRAQHAVPQQETLDRMIAATDSEIDRLVYELYELTDEEIGIVENK